MSSAPNGVASERPVATATPAVSAACSALDARRILMGGSLEGVIGRGRAPLDVRLCSEEREIRVEDRVAEEERDDGPEREERHERHAHLAS